MVENECNQLIQYNDYTQYNAVYYTIFACYMLMSIIGTITNSLLIFVILLNRSFRSQINNIYLLNLALCDLLVSLISLPLKAFELLVPITLIIPSDHWLIHTSILCNINEFTAPLLVFSSIYTLVAVCAERYFAICHPMSTLKSNGKKRAAITLIFSWLASAIICCGFLIVRYKPEILCEIGSILNHLRDNPMLRQFYSPYLKNQTIELTTPNLEEFFIAKLNTTTFPSFTTDDIYSDNSFNYLTIKQNLHMRLRCPPATPETYYKKLHVTFLFIVGYALPMILITFLCGRIIFTLYKSTNFHSDSLKNNSHANYPQSFRQTIKRFTLTDNEILKKPLSGNTRKKSFLHIKRDSEVSIFSDINKNSDNDINDGNKLLDGHQSSETNDRKKSTNNLKRKFSSYIGTSRRLTTPINMPASIQRQSENRLKLAKMMLIVIWSFMLAWTPFFMINMFTVYGSNVFRYGNFFFIGSLVHFTGFLTTCTNPLIYMCMSERFRHHIPIAFRNFAKIIHLIKSTNKSNQRSTYEFSSMDYSIRRSTITHHQKI
ncbi:hypothetical protein SNEBB_007814 [Seison nebaliae]|nr:hypothetical protein SNEBB_007814 [Seison nebaliae]